MAAWTPEQLQVSYGNDMVRPLATYPLMADVFAPDRTARAIRVK